jgi:hypothetical protein
VYRAYLKLWAPGEKFRVTSRGRNRHCSIASGPQFWHPRGTNMSGSPRFNAAHLGESGGGEGGGAAQGGGARAAKRRGVVALREICGDGTV